jgi:D-glycero-alpha-D-manno-heptose-7-phosphate kinase
MIISRTALRISFFGGGTDYPAWLKHRPGAVLATTIDKYIYVTCRYLPPIFPHKVRVSYSKTEHVTEIDQIEHPSVRECLRYLGLSSVEIHTDADLPARTGLGSSSAFTVGLLNVLHAHQGSLVTKAQLANEPMHVEQNMIGENVGCQDQVLAAHGGLCRIEFSFSGGPGFQITPIPLSRQRLDEFQQHLMLFYTGIARVASEIVVEQLRNMESKEKELLQMYGLVGEGLGVLASGRSLKDFGRLLHEGWLLKRSLSSRLSNGHIDEAYAAARQAGALGGKLLGAGGGGFLLLFAEKGCQPRIREALSRLPCVPVQLESLGSHLIFYQPNYQQADMVRWQTAG